MLILLKTLAYNARKHAGFRRYASNTSWLFAEQMIRMLAGLLVGIWVARYLGPDQFGLFSYVAAFAALFGSIAKLGLDSIVVRDLVRFPEQRVAYLATAFWLKIVGAALMLCAVAIAMQFTNSDHTTKLYIFIIACGLVFQAFEVIDFYFQSKVLSKFVSICKLIQLFISSLIKLYLIFSGAGLFWFVMAIFVDQLTLAATLYLAYRYQKIDVLFRGFDRSLAKMLIYDSWPLILSGLMIMVYMRIDQIMIKEMLGNHALGIYSAATRISEVWHFVPVLVTASIFPSIINAKKASEVNYINRIQNILTILVWISIAFILFTFAFGEWLIVALYGAAFHDASKVLFIHACGGIFVTMGVVSGSWYLSEGLQKYVFYRTALAAIINIPLNFILISKYGVIGAAIATVLTQAVAALFFDLIMKKTRAIFFIKIKSIVIINKGFFNA